MPEPLVQIAVPAPLHGYFDYRLPAGAPMPAPGARVEIPFGRQRLIGVVRAPVAHTDTPDARLRALHRVLDPDEPCLPAELVALAEWAAAYYHHPPGEVFQTLLPVLLRQGEAAEAQQLQHWRCTAQGQQIPLKQLRRAPRQAALLQRLRAADQALSPSSLPEEGDWRGAFRALVEKGLAEALERPGYGLIEGSGESVAPALNAEQQAACEALLGQAAGFRASLLDGVTGSGKTEVYLAAIGETLAAGRQALVLVPEIGLTPQLLDRFRRRYAVPIAVLHSALNERERLNAWLAAARGEARLIIGTRSAVFTPLAEPGLIVVDEEHDLSFKQQDGFRYSARDLSLVRARKLDIPIILGSATPSLESLANARAGRYQHLRLSRRAGAARPPRFQVLDARGKPLEGGLTPQLMETMRRHLDQDGQVLLFLNRRGFAPVLMCHECGWVAGCPRCDARLTWHRRAGRLRCHHCGHEARLRPHCPDCQSVDLRPIGQGTEQLESVLREHFPEQGVLRIDRDSTRRKGELQRLLEQAHAGEARLLLGTQMLAKGHDLPNITLVGIIDADQGLFGADFRAPERLGQLVVQVAGRSGRAEKPGEVAIQTHHPDHPLLQVLIHHGYERLAEQQLAERRAAGLPPYAHLALLRAEAVDPGPPEDFLEAARRQADALGLPGVQLLGPVPAPMERRAGRYRAQLLLQAFERRDLHRLLGVWVAGLGKLKEARKVRWSMDVDPLEML
ncbi:primosomal protein N' [Alkalilimnicola sp. S0819]|uniref:primosomal protein N' n=1 Tax=Alkalilimnicola sp. S0819 TaxID=2613922 RepID=UPI0012627F80|nr:primosomal protein N' [Alkalilimnicola sp. S0819]KAB7623987.1 primosomal protein N' [Alkalilimnicola sp. S0819]MPQ16591.1 primosomal protein N' [Alkalilimnicola sp. S0819]